MHWFEIVYIRTATFLRDIFQYFISGLLFSGLVLLPFYAKICNVFATIQREQSFWCTMIVIVAVIVLYVLGHILHLVSYIIFALYKPIVKIFVKPLLAEIDLKEKGLKDYLASSKFKGFSNDFVARMPIHLYFEMTTFIKRPDLHSRFIERYNLLMFFRRSLSASFFTVSFVYVLTLPQTKLFVLSELILLLISMSCSK